MNLLTVSSVKTVTQSPTNFGDAILNYISDIKRIGQGRKRHSRAHN